MGPTIVPGLLYYSCLKAAKRQDRTHTFTNACISCKTVKEKIYIVEVVDSPGIDTSYHNLHTPCKKCRYLENYHIRNVSNCRKCPTRTKWGKRRQNFLLQNCKDNWISVDIKADIRRVGRQGGGGGSCEGFLLPMHAHNTVKKRKCTCGDLGEPNDHCFVGNFLRIAKGGLTYETHLFTWNQMIGKWDIGS